MSKGKAGGLYGALGGEAAYCKMVINDADYVITDATLDVFKLYCPDEEELLMREVIGRAQ